MEWGGLFLQALMLGAFLLWEGYFKQKGKNLADKDDIRDISFESEKGKNLATKKDIEEITEKIEVIKNEISFENHRKHSFIEQRTDRFVKILHLTEELHIQKNLLWLYTFDLNPTDRLSNLIDNTNKILLSLIHECRMVSVLNKESSINEIINSLMNNSQKYASYLCAIASNANNTIASKKIFTELGTKEKDLGLLKHANEFKDQLEKLRKEFDNDMPPIEHDLYECIISYQLVLRDLFNKEFHLKFNFTNPKEETSPYA